MRRIVLTVLMTSLGVAPLATAPAAMAAKRGSSITPQITRVAPMRISVGGTLTIRGSNFKSKRSANTVIFRAPNGRSAFAKPRRASRRKLVVTVPGAVRRLLAGAASSPRPTRFKLRVLAGKFSRFTSRRLSPVVTASGGGGGGGGGGAGGTTCDSGPDHDGDLLSNVYEAQIKTDPCLKDTDLDGVEDGYEQQSAIDLNNHPRTPPLPYPGKRPYPNALDSSDAVTDYDGDGLLLSEEHTLWLRYSADGVARAGRPATLSGLVYSDGLQKSIDPAPPAPAAVLLNWTLDMDEDNQLWDDERDADADGLGNWDEAHGRMTEDWWPAQHNGTIEPKESKYPGIDFLDNEDTAPAFDAMADRDMDGDGVLDGYDDADHDGLTNMFEVRRPADWYVDAISGGTNPWAYTSPFNPCKPYDSERCHEHPPFAYYESDEVPPIGPPVPPGYPGSAPPTPDG